MTGLRTTLGALMRDGRLYFNDGYRTKRSEHADDGFRIVRAGDVADGSISLDGPDFVSEQFVSAIGEKAGAVGDIVLTTKGSVGRVGVMPATDERAVYSPQLCFFRVRDQAAIDAGFLRYWFRSGEFLRQAADRMNNTDMAAYINLADIRSLQIRLPAISEQRAIGEVLGALDDKITANTAIAQTVENLGSARFAALGIDSELGTAPTELVDYFDVNPKRTVSGKEVVRIDMQALPVSQPLISTWSKGELKGGTRFMNGDTLLARITPCLENRKTGYVDFLPNGAVGVGSTEFIVIRSKNPRCLAASYFLAVSPRFREHAIQNMVGTSGRQRVAAFDLARYRINAPGSDRYVAFGDWSFTAFQALGALRNENTTLAATRDALLPQLMSGKLRVRDAEKVLEDAGV